MPINKEELRKLSPEERIKRLKQLEKERKEEIKEADDLIKRTEAEIADKKNLPDNVEIPEIEPVDISKIFEAGGDLETTVASEAPAEERTGIKYIPSTEYVSETTSEYASENGDRAEIITKVEDTIKYESESEKVSDLASSAGVLKKIKKYTKG